VPELQLSLSELGRPVLFWLLLSLGFWLIAGKLNWKRRWMAWVPGLQYAALGQSLDMTFEGVVCCVVSLALNLNTVVRFSGVSESVQTGLALATVVLAVFLLIFRIRLYLRLLAVFELRKRWLLFWFFFDWAALIAIGGSKLYQPRRLRFTEDWEAGTAPAAISGADAIHGRAPANSGLSVDLDERTVRSGGKKRYLLKDIALDIPNGSMVLLLGGSGAGKTTLVNAIIGYEKADAKVTLNGTDIYQDYEQMKYRIGFVPQKNLIRGNDTVYRTISDAAELRLPRSVGRAERARKVKEVMDLLGLTAGADGLVSKKSGGQLRRISIAMELVSGPELFVLDEPDSGLDGVLSRELFTKLRAIADEGRIVLVITHTPDRVIDLFDKVIVLARDSGRVGRLAFYGSPQEARDFFGRETMEGVVMSVNSEDAGGDGLADYYIERYAQLAAAEKGGDAG